MNIIENIQAQLVETFKDLSFEPERHIYRANNRTMISVSSMVKKHTEPFDEMYWAERIAKKRKISVEEILKEWDDKRNIAAENGTNAHLFAETWWTEPKIEPETLQQEALKKFLEYCISKYDLIFTELQMYSKKYKYAGTCDLLLWDKENNHVVLMDYKTNFELDKQYDYLLEPFNYLANTQFNKYQLQLSYYQILLEEAGIEVKERYVVWVRHDGEYELRPCTDFSSILKTFLEKQ